jgi:hypothetical protein
MHYSVRFSYPSSFRVALVLRWLFSLNFVTNNNRLLTCQGARVCICFSNLKIPALCLRYMKVCSLPFETCTQCFGCTQVLCVVSDCSQCFGYSQVFCVVSDCRLQCLCCTQMLCVVSECCLQCFGCTHVRCVRHLFAVFWLHSCVFRCVRMLLSVFWLHLSVLCCVKVCCVCSVLSNFSFNVAGFFV